MTLSRAVAMCLQPACDTCSSLKSMQSDVCLLVMELCGLKQLCEMSQQNKRGNKQSKK